MSSFDNSNSGFSNFGSNKYVSGTKEFLESNSIVAKFAFLFISPYFICICLTFRNIYLKLYFLSFSKSYFDKWYD